MLYVFSQDQALCDFISKNIQSVPGVADITVCLFDRKNAYISKLQLEDCALCPVKTKQEVPESFFCPLRDSEQIQNTQVYPMETEEHFFGNVALQVDDEELFNVYKPLVQNLLSSVTLTLENLLQKSQLEARENHLEHLVRERTEKLEKALDEKKLLLREVHHRIKNNLNVIISLLHMQTDTIEGEAAKNALKESAQRVSTMQEIHQFLYQSEQYSFIRSEHFFPELMSSLTYSYNSTSEGRVKIEQQIDSIPLPIDTAIPCSLIVNELITNSLKHGFKANDTEGTVTFHFQRKPPHHVDLTVKDNGSGLPKNMDYTQSDTLGLKLISALTEQLEGTLIVESGDWGTSITIDIPLEEENSGSVAK